MHTLSRIFQDFKNPISLSIGVTTTIGYGTLYYLFAVFAPVISGEFDIRLDQFFAIFAIGLLLGGLFAPLVGMAIDNYGAQKIMCSGSILAASSLVFLSTVTNLWAFGAAVIAMELAACMVFYEAAFAGLTHIYGQNARRHITSVTLIAGFASTIFWPLTQFMVHQIGWRETCLFFALLHVIICLPLHWFALGTNARKKATQRTEKLPPSNENTLKGEQRKRAILLYGFAVCASGMVFALVPLHLLIILQYQGIGPQHAAILAMVMGPAQVVARIIEMTGHNKYSSLTTGKVCLAMLPISIVLLLLPYGSIWSAIAFTAFYGISQGLSNIMRGTVPLELFGSFGYATLVGKITGIRFVLNAGAPFLFALVLTQGGMNMALWSIFGIAVISAFAYWQIPAIKPADQETTNSNPNSDI